MARIWVDYNARHSSDVTFTLLEYADADLAVGEPVTTFDGEGNECPGVVDGIDRPRGLVDIRLDLDAFRPATA